MFVGVCFVAILIVAIGIAEGETWEFYDESRFDIATAAYDIRPILIDQFRSGRSLAQATAFAAAHIPHNIALVATDNAANVVYWGGPIFNSQRYRISLILNAAYQWRYGYPRGVYVETLVFPKGKVDVYAKTAFNVDVVTGTLREMIPFVLCDVLVCCVLACMIASYAIRPFREQRSMLRKLSEGHFTPIPTNPRALTEIRDLNLLHNAAAAGLQRAIDERELAAESIRSFIADASHELKTPLTIIMGYVDAVAAGLVTEKGDAERIMARTLGECRRMRNTIENLITLARLDHKEEGLGAFDPASLTIEIVESLKPLATDLQLEIRVPDDTLACGNAEEVREAVVTVIDNALKYAPGSPIDVRVTENSRAVVIEVADAGPGMSPEERERAFERFHRGFHPTVEGSGLGLAIAKRAVERAHGHISLTSEPGVGTTVTLYLPRA